MPCGSGIRTVRRDKHEYGDDRIEFGPGRSEHSWTQLRGALPKLQGDSVYLTGFTPFEFRLVLR